jgi:hypothetical protein
VIPTTTIRQDPPDHRGGYELETKVLEVEADTSDQAYAALVDQVPGDWSMLAQEWKPPQTRTPSSRTTTHRTDCHP